MWNHSFFSESRSSTPRNSRSSHPITTGKHEWTIEDFLTREEGVGVSLNTKFSVPANEVRSGTMVETVWRIKVYPRGCDAEHANYASIFINQAAGPAVWVKYAFCILGASSHAGTGVDSSGFQRGTPSEHNTRVGSVQFLADRRNSSRGWKKFICLSLLRAPSNPYLQEANLVIRCTVELECRDQLHPNAASLTGGLSSASSLTQVGPSSESAALSRLPSSLSSTSSTSSSPATLLSQEGRISHLEDMKYTDLALVCEGREFPCHKFMLARKSDVFDAMFSHEFRESVSNQVHITDLDADSVQEMIRFLYIGRVWHMDRVNRGLFVTADKYNIGELKEACEKSLSSTMSVGNVCSLLLFARDRMADQLKKKAIEFISRNSVDVTNSDGWKDLVHEPTLVTEVVQAMGPKYL
eukprot:snap_masked-scaffold1057_size73593-processed-gene-0.19 protein:Tk01346 transcript:snap_masked-scaffold1057_size73593-processed-gene-0.19-mRNA-1 annotation:"speckle-type poz isoform x2"